jgi:hypothetical protein
LFSSISVSEKATDLLSKVSFFVTDTPQQITGSNTSLNPTGWDYLYNFNYFVPQEVVGSILNSAIPEWSSTDFILNSNPNISKGNISQEYFGLFIVIDRYLVAMVQNTKLTLENVMLPKEIIPNSFKGLLKEDKISLPEVAVNWMRNQRDIDKNELLKAKLVNTFFVLLTLGAFGSVVVLIKDFISGSNNTPFLSYIFRPILGMFLAMAVFLLDVLAHSLISTSAIETIRMEPLYVLGFAAGVLAEQAYGIILTKAQFSLDSFKEKNKE